MSIVDPIAIVLLFSQLFYVDFACACICCVFRYGDIRISHHNNEDKYLYTPVHGRYAYRLDFSICYIDGLYT